MLIYDLSQRDPIPFRSQSGERAGHNVKARPQCYMAPTTRVLIYIQSIWLVDQEN